MRPARAVLATAAGLVLSSPVAAQVTTAQYDNARTGAQRAEHVLTPQNVNPATFGKVRSIPVDGDVYAQVLYLPRLGTGGGPRAAVFVATEHNSVYAFDAATAETLWHVNLTPAGAEAVSSRDVGCPFIRPEVGITATPVIDTTTNTMYVLARTKAGGGYQQRLHALDLSTGGERAGSPVEIRASVRRLSGGSERGAVAFNPLRDNPRAALLLTGGHIVMAWASSCDIGPYHGWVMAYDAHSLAQIAVFSATPNGSEGGIWQGDAGLAADQDGVIYAATGNGTFSADAGGVDYGDTILELTIDAAAHTLAVHDYFTPYDQATLDKNDEDLGSGGPVLIDLPGGAHPRLVFVGGKGGSAYLLDRNHLGRFNPAGNAAVLHVLRAPDMIMGAGAFWNGRLFTVWGSDVLKSWTITDGRLAASPTAQGTVKFPDGGATPVVSANGANAGIVWVVESKNWNERERTAVLHAFDAANVTRGLFSSETNAGRDRAGSALRFAMPTIADGRVYVGVKGAVEVYGLLSGR